MADLLARLRDRAARTPRRIVFPESGDPRILGAATQLVALKMARPILVGSPAVVEGKARELGLRLSHIEVVDFKAAAYVEKYANILIAEWRSRGVTEVEAQQRLQNPMYFAAAMVRAGDADGFVGGASTTTAETVRAAIHCIGLSRTSSVVSSFFLMVLPGEQFGAHGALVFSDCAVIPSP